MFSANGSVFHHFCGQFRYNFGQIFIGGQWISCSNSSKLYSSLSSQRRVFVWDCCKLPKLCCNSCHGVRWPKNVDVASSGILVDSWAKQVDLWLWLDFQQAIFQKLCLGFRESHWVSLLGSRQMLLVCPAPHPPLTWSPLSHWARVFQKYWLRWLILKFHLDQLTNEVAHLCLLHQGEGGWSGRMRGKRIRISSPSHTNCDCSA